MASQSSDIRLLIGVAHNSVDGDSEALIREQLSNIFKNNPAKIAIGLSDEGAEALSVKIQEQLTKLSNSNAFSVQISNVTIAPDVISSIQQQITNAIDSIIANLNINVTAKYTEPTGMIPVSPPSGGSKDGSKKSSKSSSAGSDSGRSSGSRSYSRNPELDAQLSVLSTQKSQIGKSLDNLHISDLTTDENLRIQEIRDYYSTWASCIEKVRTAKNLDTDTMKTQREALIAVGKKIQEQISLLHQESEVYTETTDRVIDYNTRMSAIKQTSGGLNKDLMGLGGGSTQEEIDQIASLKTRYMDLQTQIETAKVEGSKSGDSRVTSIEVEAAAIRKEIDLIKEKRAAEEEAAAAARQDSNTLLSTQLSVLSTQKSQIGKSLDNLHISDLTTEENLQVQKIRDSYSEWALRIEQVRNAKDLDNDTMRSTREALVTEGIEIQKQIDALRKESEAYTELTDRVIDYNTRMSAIKQTSGSLGRGLTGLGDGTTEEEVKQIADLKTRYTELQREIESARLAGVESGNDRLASIENEASAIRKEIDLINDRRAAEKEAAEVARQDYNASLNTQLSVLSTQKSQIGKSLDNLQRSSLTDTERADAQSIRNDYQSYITQEENLRNSTGLTTEQIIQQRDALIELGNQLLARTNNLRQNTQATEDAANATADYKTSISNISKQSSTLGRSINSLSVGTVDGKNNADEQPKIDAIKARYAEFQKQLVLAKQSGVEGSKERIQELEKELAEIQKLVTAYKETQENTDDKGRKGRVNDISKTILDAEKNYNDWTAAKIGKSSSAYQNLGSAIQDLYSIKAAFDSGKISAADFDARYEKTCQDITDASTIIRAAGENTKSFGDHVGGLASKFTSWLSVSQIIMRLYRSLRQMVSAVIEIDTAMTELKKVTDETDRVYSNFLNNAISRAKTLGATVADTVNASADFARLGYTLEESEDLADAALVYKNVGDGIDDISEASESIISTMKAFGVETEDAMTIVDKFNEVGNNFAISSEGVGEALQRSASALYAGNNTLEESIALITAANSVIQDPDSVGTAMKTISMYLRAAKTEAEEAGESTDGMANSVSELRDEILSLTGGQVNLMADDSTFKSTYAIIKELSEVWGSLTDVSQANILELIGGKRNSNVIASMLENFDVAEKVIETASNSSGSALKENEKYLDSINGKVAEFKATFEELSASFLDTDTVKGFVEFGTGALNVLNFLTDIINLLGGLNTLLGVTAGLIMTLNAAKVVDTLKLIIKPLTSLKTSIAGFITSIKAGTTAGMTFGEALSASFTGAATGATTLSATLSTVVGVVGLVVIAVTAIYTVYQKLHKSTEELREEYDKHTETLQDLNDELDTNKARIEELQKMTSNNKITLVEQEELDKLITENEQLERNIRLEKERQQAVASKTNASVIKDYERESFESITGTNTLVDAGAIRENNQDAFEAYENMLNGYSDAWDTLTAEKQNQITSLYGEWQNAILNAGNAAEIPETLGYNEYIQELIDRYNELSALGSDATDGQVSQMESIREELLNLYSDLDENYIGMYTGEDGEALDNWNALADAIDACLNPAQHFTDQLEKMPDYLQALLKTGGSDGITTDYINELVSQYSELSAWMEESGYTAEQLANHYNSFISDSDGETELFTATLSDLSDTISSIQSAREIAETAEEEMAAGTGLSVDTISSLIDETEDYLDYLYEENGVIKLNTEAWLENSNAVLNREIEDISKESDGLSEQTKELQAQNRELEEKIKISKRSGETDTVKEYTDKIKDNNKVIEENKKKIEANNSKLSLRTNILKSLSSETEKLTELETAFANLETAKDDASVLSSVISDLEENERVSFSTLSDLQEKFGDVSNIESFINQLKTATSTSQEVTDIIGSLLYSSLVNAMGSTEDLANADETLIEVMLEEADIANAAAVAHKAVAQAKIESQVAASAASATTATEINSLIAEQQSAGNASQAIYSLIATQIIFNNTGMNVTQKLKALQSLANAASSTAGIISGLNNISVSGTTGMSTKQVLQEAKEMVKSGSASSLTEAKQKLLQNYWSNQAATISASDSNPFGDIDFSAASSSGGGGGSSETQAETIKSAYDELSTSIEHAIFLQEQYYTKADNSSDYNGMRQSLDKQVQYYKQIQNSAHDAAQQIRSYYKSQGMSNALIEQQSEIQELQQAWWNAEESINDCLDKISNAVREKLSQQLDDIQSAYETLHNAADEYADSGFITVDTLQTICNELGPQYLSYLRDENGQLVINEENIRSVIAARTEQLAVETALSYVEQLRTALEDNDVEKLNNLLYATESTTNATWGLVYASLGLLDMSSDQYQAALSNINALRSLADSAISSIGQTANSVSDTLQDMKDGVDDILDYVMSMLEQRIEDQVDALEDMKDAYSDIISLRKEALETAKEEADYQDEVAEKVKEIAKLQSRINSLSLDDSRDAQSQKIQLQEEMSELQKELADTQNDYAIDAQKEALDEMQTAYEEQKDAEIEALENSISSYQKKYDMAIDYIENNWDTLLSELTDWNYEYGSDLTETITEAWNNALAAAQKYGSYVQALNNIDDDIESGSYSNTIIGNTTYDSSSSAEEQIHAIIKEMYANSQAHHTATTDEQARLDKRNLTLGAMLAQYGVNAYRKNGVWYDEDGSVLYQKYKNYIYHNGGIAGNEGSLKQNEVLAKLEKGEAVLDDNKQSSLYKIIDFTTVLSDRMSKLLGMTDVSRMFSHIQSNIMNAASSLVPVTNMNQSPNITFGNVYIYGQDDETVAKHREINRQFTNDILKQLNIKR